MIVRRTSVKAACEDVESPRASEEPCLTSERRKSGFPLVFSALAVFCIVVFVSSGQTTTLPPQRKAENNVRKAVQQHFSDQCTVWVAPSSLQGNPGYGVFTTRDIAKKEKILDGHDGVAIPLVGFYDKRNLWGPAKNIWTKVWNNYVWTRGVPDHVFYEGGTDTADYQIGFGSLPNHHCMLDSLHSTYPDTPYDDSLVNRYQDPGAGAFSYNMGREFVVRRDMKAGEELFLNYGYCDHNGNVPGWTDQIFMTGDYSQAAEIVYDIIWNSLKGTPGGMTYDAAGKIDVPKHTSKLVERLLPKTTEELEKMKLGVKSRKELPMYIAQHIGLNHREPDWIRSNGMCLENLVPRPSTIPQAGQGAIAQFGIRKGEIVTPAPLLQIMDHDALTLYDENGKQNGTELLLNYCFAHPESTILLCPNTNAVLINHCSTRTKECGSRGPNAEYRWSRGWDPTSDAWRKMSLEQIAQEPGRGLAFEIVALRDIQPGEEIFIDYGPEWEQAWETHVANWKPPSSDSDTPVSVKELNEKGGPVIDELVSGDLRKTVDHELIFTGCQYYDGEDDDDFTVEAEDKDETNGLEWEKLSDKELLKRYADNGKWHTDDYRGYKDHDDNSHWPCSVIKQNENGSYTVRIHQNPWAATAAFETKNSPQFLTNYPREAIRYFVKPYKSDQHLSGAFRHPIGLRDDIFPKQWKNKQGKQLPDVEMTRIK